MELTPEQQALAEQWSAERKARREADLAAMTVERAVATLWAAAKTLGDNDYLSGEYQLNLIAEWLQAQQSKEA